MGLLDKVKNFFYDEEEVEDEYEETMPIKVHRKEKKEKVKERLKVREIENEPEEKQDISERELFKAERTFNFPMDIYDEDEKTSSIKIEKEEINNNSSTEKVSKPIVHTYNTTKQENPYSNIRSYAKYEEKKEEKEVKKFKPTPVISPIYGILDKNYKKEDVIIDNASYDKPKKVDYDEVRKKAYKNVYKEEPEEKGIFYNLDEEKNEELEEDVKIVYNDVTYDEEENDDNVTIGQKIDEYEREEEANQIDDYDTEYEEKDEDEINDDSNILSETKEQDLFNLIDNMYNSDEDEEDE